MMKRLITVVFGICFGLNGHGQDQEILDSLHLVLRDAVGGDRYPALRCLALEYVDVDNERALAIIEEAEQAARLSGDSVWIVKSRRVKGQVLSKLGRFEEVLAANEFTYPLARRLGLVEECMLIANTSGCAYLIQSRFDKGLEYFFRSYDIAVQGNDSSGIAMSLENIGITYYKLRDYEKGLHFLEKCLEVRLSLGEVPVYTPMNISLCYAHLHDFVNARAFLEESIKNCGLNCDNLAMTHIKYTAGIIFQGLAEYDSAEIAFLRSHSLAKELGDRRMQLDNIYWLAKLYTKKNRLEEAALLLAKGEQIIQQEIPFNMEIIKMYFRLSELFSSMKNFKKASIYQKKYITLKDSIYSEALTTSLMKVESEFLERKNKAKIAAKDEVIFLKETVISNQKQLIVVNSFLVITILAFLVSLYRDYRKKKNLNRLLARKVKERTSELELNRDILLRSMREKDLHILRVSGAISETTNTIEGLCVTGMQEVSEPLAQIYLDRIRKTTERLSENYQLTFRVR